MSGFDDYSSLLTSATPAEPDTDWLNGYRHKGSGRGGSAAPATPAPAAAPADVEPAQVDGPMEPDTVAAAPVETGHPSQDGPETPPAPLQHTDTQDAIQADTAPAARTGSAGGAETRPALPGTSFSMGGAKGQLKIVGVPEALLEALRTQIRVAAASNGHATAAGAQEFAVKLSQKSLVVAFLMAQLDVVLEVDASTAKAVALFREADPVMASVLGRLDNLLESAGRQSASLEKTLQCLGETRDTALAVEQSAAYLVADRVENLGKGILSANDVLLGHKSAITARDRAREEMRKRRRLEQDRDGRPIR